MATTELRLFDAKEDYFLYYVLMCVDSHTSIELTDEGFAEIDCDTLCDSRSSTPAGLRGKRIQKEMIDLASGTGAGILVRRTELHSLDSFTGENGRKQ